MARRLLISLGGKLDSPLPVVIDVLNDSNQMISRLLFRPASSCNLRLPLEASQVSVQSPHSGLTYRKRISPQDKTVNWIELGEDLFSGEEFPHHFSCIDFPEDFFLQEYNFIGDNWMPVVPYFRHVVEMSPKLFVIEYRTPVTVVVERAIRFGVLCEFEKVVRCPRTSRFSIAFRIKYDRGKKTRTVEYHLKDYDEYAESISKFLSLGLTNHSSFISQKVQNVIDPQINHTAFVMALYCIEEEAISQSSRVGTFVSSLYRDFNSLNTNEFSSDLLIACAWRLLHKSLSQEFVDNARRCLIEAASKELMPFYALSFRLLIEGMELIHSYEEGQDSDLLDARQKALQLGDAFDPRSLFFTMSVDHPIVKTSFRGFSHSQPLLYRPYVVNSVITTAPSISRNINSTATRLRKRERQGRIKSNQNRLWTAQSPLAHEQIVLRPKITEKSLNRMSRYGHYYFIVHRNANKTQIKKAVENLFKVSVEKVMTQNIKESGKRQAIVKLRPGQTINDLSSLLSPPSRGLVHS